MCEILIRNTMKPQIPKHKQNRLWYKMIKYENRFINVTSVFRSTYTCSTWDLDMTKKSKMPFSFTFPWNVCI
jgi:hypothetical protein